MQKRYNKKAFVSLQDNFNVHYLSSFLDYEEAKEYYDIFEKTLKYNSDEESKIKIHGKEIKIPRSQVAYGDPGVSYKFSGIKVEARSWDQDTELCNLLRCLKNKVEKFIGQKFNFVLINRYANGNEYIGFHSDDERDIVEGSSIVGISLGAEREFKFKPKKFIPVNIPENLEITLANGSIVTMNYPTNDHWMHSIPKRAKIRTPRISLTFRLMHH